MAEKSLYDPFSLEELREELYRLYGPPSSHRPMPPRGTSYASSSSRYYEPVMPNYTPDTTMTAIQSQARPIQESTPVDRGGLQLLHTLYEQVELITDEGDKFRNRYGFSIQEYLTNRTIFVILCRDHADRIERLAKDTGIARVVGGSVNILSGIAALAGLFLVPVTAGASVALTVGGIAGGILGGANNVVAQLYKDGRTRSDVKKIETALKRFEQQEEVVFDLIQKIQQNFTQLRSIGRKAASTNGILYTAGKGAISLGKKANSLEKSIRGTAKFVEFTKKAKDAACGCKCVKDIAATATTMADEIVAPGFRTVITAGSTTAKLLAGSMSAIGIVFGIWDVYSASEDIKGSDIAEAYRRFACEYEVMSNNLREEIERLSAMIE